MNIIDDALMVCSDCLMIIANDDATGLDYYLSDRDAAAREQEIRAAILELGSNERYIAVGNSQFDDEFSSSPCACCGVRLAGPRYHCVLVDAG
ncbi:hypothetical protein LL947_05615 [Halomonas sp. BLK-85]